MDVVSNPLESRKLEIAMFSYNPLNKRLKIRKIGTTDELYDYIEKTSDQIGVRFPIEYLEKARVVGIFMDGKLLGGFAIVPGKNLRVLESIKDKKKNIQIPENVSELTGLWLDESIRSFFSTRLWIHIYFDILTHENQYFVYSYSLKKKNLRKLYDNFPKQVIYRGLIEKLPGMEEDDYESIELISKKDVLFFPFKNFDFFIRRMGRT